MVKVKPPDCGLIVGRNVSRYVMEFDHFLYVF